MLARLSRIAEVPIVFVDRRVGQSKMNSRIFLEAVTMTWWLRLRSGFEDDRALIVVHGLEAMGGRRLSGSSLVFGILGHRLIRRSGFVELAQLFVT